MKSHFTAIKSIFRFLKGFPNLAMWYLKYYGFNLIGFSDSDNVGCRICRKSIIGSCQFLGERLVSCFSKKMHSVSNSTTDTKYISVEICCAQLLWMRNQQLDYDLVVNNIQIYCDNTSAIAISYNLV